MHKIIETSLYKNEEIDVKDQNFIKSQIAEIGYQGYLFQQQKQYEFAQHCYELKIKSNPNDPSSEVFYANKGISLKKLQRYEEAIQMYDKAIQLNPQDSDYYSNKGISLKKLQRYEEAIQMYDKAIQLNPQKSHYYSNKGNSLKNLQRYEDAKIMFQNAKQLQNS